MACIGNQLLGFKLIDSLWGGIWMVFLKDVDPWGLYMLILLAIFTLALPLYMFFFSSKHMAVMARLTPEYERPEGH